MYRAALRSSSSSIVRAARQPALAGGARRMLSTTPTSGKSTWKGSVARWGVAIGALYWYNTSPIFADEAARQVISAPPEVPEAELRSVDAVLEEKRKHDAIKVEKIAKEPKKSELAAQDGAAAPSVAGEFGGPQSPEALEGEAGQQGAFNPETGEINWDCPCLGGMADGPCGEDFKAAFSCFVYSEQEPKGMDCIDKFQHMQDCFRQHPDIYGAELADDEQEGGAPDAQPLAAADDSAAVTIETSEAAPTTASSAIPVAPSAPVEPAATETTEKAVTAGEASAPVAADAVAAVPEPVKPAASKPAKKASPAASKSKEPVHAEPTNTFVEDAHVPQAAFDATSANK